jgi:outer membrane receptor protein involved in Fe transport
MVSGFKGQHLIKAGLDLMSSGFHGTSDSGAVEVYRTDLTLNTKIEYSGGAPQSFRATNGGAYLQDHWRFSDRLGFELGGRLDYDAVPGRTNLSPRAGAVISLLPQARGVLRGGAGLFYEQTPLNVAAFETYESQTVTRFDAGGLTPLGPPVTWQHQTHPGFSDRQDRLRLR